MKRSILIILGLAVARHTCIAICPEGGEGCFAAGPGGFLRERE
jgi:hypothetical protein